MVVQYIEDMEEATQIARAALPLASKLELPANPINYAVLYEYMAGHNPQLKQAFDQIQGKLDKLTTDKVQDLYRKYITRTDERAMNDLRESLSIVIDTMQESVQRIDAESQQYESDLDVGAEEMEESTDRDEMMSITSRLIRETRKMQLTSRMLHEELEKVSMELAQLREDYQRVRSESLEDPVTGTNNRRAFNYAISTMCEEASEEGVPLSLLMVDMDHFKRVNDTHGHVVGDAVLKWMAQLIDEQVRGGDFLARYGGEEFAVLLRDTSLTNAQQVAENIRRRTQGQRLKHSELGQNIGCLTVSIGVASYHPGESIAAFVGRSDDALYNAKQSGRNRVSTSPVAENNVA